MPVQFCGHPEAPGQETSLPFDEPACDFLRRRRLDRRRSWHRRRPPGLPVVCRAPQPPSGGLCLGRARSIRAFEDSAAGPRWRGGSQRRPDGSRSKVRPCVSRRRRAPGPTALLAVRHGATSTVRFSCPLHLHPTAAPRCRQEPGGRKRVALIVDAGRRRSARSARPRICPRGPSGFVPGPIPRPHERAAVVGSRAPAAPLASGPEVPGRRGCPRPVYCRRRICERPPATGAVGEGSLS